MSRQTEKILAEFHKFLDGRELKGEKEFEEVLNEFMAGYNNKDFSKLGEDAWDYVELAYQADNDEDVLKYAKKALEIDANCTDAEVLIAETTATDAEQLQSKLEKLLVKTEEKLKETGFFEEDNIGHFWGIFQTRPYMRLKYAYASLLAKKGKFKKAINICEDLLTLSDSDNLGVRYLLISLYAFFEDEVNVMRLYKKFEEEPSSQMILPIVALYYKLDNYKKAETYLKKLNKINPGLKLALEDIHSIELSDLDFLTTGTYQLGTKEEIIVAMNESYFLYSSTATLIPWLETKLAGLEAKSKRKK